VDDVAAFDFVTPPCAATLEAALEDLYALGAIDAEARVVDPLGLRMAHGPVSVLLMRLLMLAAEPQHACAAEAATICAMLTVQSPWLHTRNKDRLNACQQSFAVYEGDLVTLLNLFNQYEAYRGEDPEWAKRHLLNAAILDRALRIRQQLLQHLGRFDLPVKSCDSNVETLQRVACAAFFLNAARRTPNGFQIPNAIPTACIGCADPSTRRRLCIHASFCIHILCWRMRRPTRLPTSWCLCRRSAPATLQSSCTTPV